ncbi:MAG: hypothetical protein WA265_14550 [Rhodomicrobium sp.]
MKAAEPGVCVLGYGRLGEALTKRLSQACGGIQVLSRKAASAAASNVRFFTNPNDVVQGARFVLDRFWN